MSSIKHAIDAIARKHTSMTIDLESVVYLCLGSWPVAKKSRPLGFENKTCREPWFSPEGWQSPESKRFVSGNKPNHCLV